MMLLVQIISFLYEIETGKNRAGSRRERGRKRDREKWIKRVGGQMYVRIKTAWFEKMTNGETSVNVYCLAQIKHQSKGDKYFGWFPLSLTL
jgi:hypothetical protein